MRFFPVLLCLCLLAACAAQPSSRRTSDLATCRRNADQTMGPVSIDPADEHTPGPMALARREELRGQYDSLVQDCMVELPPFTDTQPSDAPPK